MTPAKWFVSAVAILGLLVLLLGILNQSRIEVMWSFLPLGMAAFAWFTYVRQ
jgi:uncharacterized integral membrane protein